jgi:hypothetical protein
MRLADELGRPIEGLDVGWLTYVAERRSPACAFDKKLEVIPIKGSGRLIVATRQRFSSSNPSHVKRARLVGAALDARVT